MKKIIFYTVFIFSAAIFAQSANLDWQYNYKKTLKVARKNHKPVLVYFSGSDWCSPCRRLKNDLFEAAQHKALLEDYNLLYIDIPQNKDLVSVKQYKHNKDVLSKLNPKKSFPSIVLLNHRGRVKKRMSGYFGKDQLHYYLDFLKR